MTVQEDLSLKEDLAYFLGILAGDGHISKPKPHQASWWTIQMCEDDFEFQTKVYTPLVKRLFGYTPRIGVNKRRDGRRNVYSRIYSLRIITYLTKVLGIKNGYKTDTVEVPKFILEAENEKSRIAFVRGLFDTDGTVTGSTIKYSTVSEKLFSQVRSILRCNGIPFSIHTWKKNERAKLLYTLVIPRREAETFRQIIGFKNLRKRIRLDKILAPSSSGQG